MKNQNQTHSHANSMLKRVNLVEFNFFSRLFSLMIKSHTLNSLCNADIIRKVIEFQDNVASLLWRAKPIIFLLVDHKCYLIINIDSH